MQSLLTFPITSFLAITIGAGPIGAHGQLLVTAPSGLHKPIRPLFRTESASAGFLLGAQFYCPVRNPEKCFHDGKADSLGHRDSSGHPGAVCCQMFCSRHTHFCLQLSDACVALGHTQIFVPMARSREVGA